MNILISVIIAVIAYLFGCFGFKRVLIALSIISKKYILMPLASFLLWLLIMSIPYFLIQHFLPEHITSLLIGYFASILVTYRKVHSIPKK